MVIAFDRICRSGMGLIEGNAVSSWTSEPSWHKFPKAAQEIGPPNTKNLLLVYEERLQDLPAPYCLYKICIFCGDLSHWGTHQGGCLTMHQTLQGTWNCYTSWAQTNPMEKALQVTTQIPQFSQQDRKSLSTQITGSLLLLPFPQVEEMLRYFSAVSKIPSLSKPQFCSQKAWLGLPHKEQSWWSAFASLLPFLGWVGCTSGMRHVSFVPGFGIQIKQPELSDQSPRVAAADLLYNY